jgi:scyllo-inositol 2-dehydrogenase (NADP+)
VSRIGSWRYGSGMVHRVLLVGFGLGGRIFHAPFVSAEPGLELVGIVTNNSERRAQAAQEYPKAALFADLAEGLAAAPGLGVDVCVISTAVHVHVEQVLAALAAGLHVVIDKPVAPSADEIREIEAAAKRAQRLVVPYQNRRFDGDFRTLQALVAEGAKGPLGQIARFESRFEKWRPEVVKDSWKESGEPGTSLLHDLGSHLVDQALLLFGAVDTVYSIGQRVRPDSRNHDSLALTLTHQSGVVSQVWMSMIAADFGPRFRVLGSKGAYVSYGLDVQEDQLRFEERRPAPQVEWGVYPTEMWGSVGTTEDHKFVPTLNGDMRLFWSEFVGALNNGTPPPVLLSDALRTHTVIDAAILSAETNTLVRL